MGLCLLLPWTCCAGFYFGSGFGAAIACVATLAEDLVHPCAFAISFDSNEGLRFALGFGIAFGSDGLALCSC